MNTGTAPATQITHGSNIKIVKITGTVITFYIIFSKPEPQGSASYYGAGAEKLCGPGPDGSSHNNDIQVKKMFKNYT
jgi:hypothetical protein